MTGTSEAKPCPHNTSTRSHSPATQAQTRPAANAEAQAQQVFAALAPVMAARRSMRLWSPETGRFDDRARTLTKKLPDAPAAVPLYVARRTRLVALDFDAKTVGIDQVEADVAQCLAWLDQIGARAACDRSTSGGRHVLIPLPDGLSLLRTDIEPTLRTLAARLASLDISPMLNDRSGAITVPGSRCREGGFRTLDGTLAAALDTMEQRSTGDSWHQLGLLLTDHDTSTARTAHKARTPPSAARGTSSENSAELWEGAAAQARLRARFRRHTPIPAEVLGFARDGRAPAGRWRARDGRVDRSAARQAVLAAAVLRGYSLDDLVRELPTQGGGWIGLAGAYDRYGHQAGAALSRDWAAACRWAARSAPEFLARVHKIQEHTGGIPGASAPRASAVHRRWLAAAVAWVDAQWPNSPKRWTAHTVLQAVAWAAARRGELHRGVATAEFGGRSLSLAAGGMPETTVWQTLREIRELPGAPLLRIRAATGHLADRYALTTPRIADRPVRVTRGRVERTRVERVHPSWRVVGLSSRRLYEAVVAGAGCPADAFAAAGLSRSSGYTALGALTTVGLVTQRHGTIARGRTGLDDIARAHGLGAHHVQTVARHRAQRACWQAWLAVHTCAPSRNAYHSPKVVLRPRPSSGAQAGTRHGTAARCAGVAAPGAHAVAPATRPARARWDSSEVFVEARPRLGGQWLVLPDGSVRYRRPSGVFTESVVSAALLRSSPAWIPAPDL